jgi:ketosteroid isomerase-like protein
MRPPTSGSVLVAGALLMLLAAPASAQSGVPGGRIDTAREHRARVRAEAFASVAEFLARWRDAWNGGDANALARLYAAEASARLPGQRMVQGSEPLGAALSEAVAAGTPISESVIDFESDGETAAVVSHYYMVREGRSITGIVVAMLVRTGRTWRLRMHVFDDALQPFDPLPGGDLHAHVSARPSRGQ